MVKSQAAPSLDAAEPPVRARRFAKDPIVTEVDIWLRRLPSGHDGLGIIHLTDIHHGLFTSLAAVQRAVQIANQLKPDLVALTGDYVTLSPAYIGPVARALGKLHARLGVFAVLGNHDFQVDAEAVTKALRDQQIQVLRNARRPLRTSSGTLWLVGVDDLWWSSDDLPSALDSVPAGDAKILLCHNPKGILQASHQGIDLVLSGHTHGGQVRLPGVNFLYRSKLGTRFVEGWNRLGETQIYVNRGIGKVVVPVRVSCPPEIARIVLHCA
ncbi:MAG TPA: metallophosphoesterase [Terriglobia bacterium]|nr:metallophosphoesterase [Terriglobia bacterium]